MLIVAAAAGHGASALEALFARLHGVLGVFHFNSLDEADGHGHESAHGVMDLRATATLWKRSCCARIVLVALAV